MASDKQIVANKINAQSAGVKTEAGKEKIRFNALKHGLTAKTLLVDSKLMKETPELYSEILSGLVDSLKPNNFFESSLVEQMARALFKLHRYEYLEAGAFSEHSSFLKLGELQLSVCERNLNNALRYKTSIENQFYRAYSSLLVAKGPKQLDLFCNSEGIYE